MSCITGFCHITGDSLRLNGQLVLERSADTDVTWFRQIYNFLGLDYPKFHKMDRLSQVGLLGTETLKSVNKLITRYSDNEIALLFANSESSADTDLRFENSYIDGGSPSPSLFVYTLPNILLGEIAIRNKWYGENMFFVFPKFTPEFFENYGQILFNKGTKAIMSGWVSLAQEEVDAFFFFTERETRADLPFTKANLADLYKNK